MIPMIICLRFYPSTIALRHECHASHPDQNFLNWCARLIQTPESHKARGKSDTVNRYHVTGSGRQNDGILNVNTVGEVVIYGGLSTSN